MKTSITAFLVATICHNSLSQSFENIKAETFNNRILVTYDLKSPETGVWVDVKLFCSYNGYTSAIAKNVFGDIGKVRPGVLKRIEWLPEGVLDNYNGDLTFELLGDMVGDLRVISKSGSISIKRGVTKEIQWTGGRQNEEVSVELHNLKKEKIFSTTATKLEPIYVQVDKKTSIGKGYSLRINSVDEKISVPVMVKPKIARPLYVFPVAVIAAIVYWLESGKAEPLPDAPRAPFNN